MPKTNTTKSGAPNEAAIRDYLADHLDLVEPGLTLLGAEVKLESPDGADGFLDIFARDAKGVLVIIEIKRTRSAAREALQELYKYVALLRTNRLLASGDYRVILLSVDWFGLLDPYSEFYPHAPFAVSAGRIELDAAGMPARIEPVTAPPAPATRRIAVRHVLWAFVDQAAADAAAAWLGRHFNALGLTDFVLVRSRPADRGYGGRWFLYFGQQELSFDAYYALLKVAMDDDQLSEFDENVQDLVEPEDRVAEAADAIWSARGTPYRQEIAAVDMEIAYPEKARQWFRDIDQADLHIHRFGRFTDPWLTDDMILADLIGDTGTSDYRLNYTAHTRQRHEIEELKRRLENVLFYNPNWLGSALQLLRYAERRGDATVTVTAFSNEDVLRTVAAMRAGGPIFMPHLKIEIAQSSASEVFIGTLEWDGSPFNYERLVADRFQGDIFNHFLGYTLGGNRGSNPDLMADLGLRYGVFRPDADGRMERFRVQGTAVVADGGPPPRFIGEFIDANADAAEALLDVFMTTDLGFARVMTEFVRFQLADAQVEVLVAGSPRSDDLYWTGTVSHCDLCQTSLEGRRFMLDAALPRGGAANMCAPCFVDLDGRLGPGRGQAYRRDAKGWRVAAG